MTSKQGLLEVAHRGVVFLDEIGDLDPQVQPKLLKVLEEKRFRRLGEVRDRQIDVQLIAATHQDLAGLAREKKFRSDLYYRISTIPLRVPSLRERQEDIPVLTRRLIEGFSADLGRRGLRLSPEAEARLGQYAWPGRSRIAELLLETRIAGTQHAMLDSAETLRFMLSFKDDSQGSMKRPKSSNSRVRSSNRRTSNWINRVQAFSTK